MKTETKITTARKPKQMIKREDQPTTTTVTVDDLIKELGGGA